MKKIFFLSFGMLMLMASLDLNAVRMSRKTNSAVRPYTAREEITSEGAVSMRRLAFVSIARHEYKKDEEFVQGLKNKFTTGEEEERPDVEVLSVVPLDLDNIDNYIPQIVYSDSSIPGAGCIALDVRGIQKPAVKAIKKRKNLVISNLIQLNYELVGEVAEVKKQSNEKIDAEIAKPKPSFFRSQAFVCCGLTSVASLGAGWSLKTLWDNWRNK